MDGTPFSVLMDRAVKLKTSQTAHERAKYDAFPSFYAGTICPNAEVAAVRALTEFSARLAAAHGMKEEGNAAFRGGRPDDARTRYQTALSVFRYLENTNPRWKSEGIQDKFVREVQDAGEDAGEQQEMNRFLVNCYNNLALVSFRMEDFPCAVQACDHALAVDGHNPKALFLRARARLAPRCSGADDQALARSDLQVALEHDPGNREALKLLSTLRQQRKTQQANDRRCFQGLFDRGEVYEERELQEQKERRCAEETQIDTAQRDIVLGRQLAQMYKERGLEKERAQLERSLEKATEPRVAVKDVDFRNPSATMVRDAKAMGVDLTNPETVAVLENMKGGHGEEQFSEDTVRSSNRFIDRGMKHLSISILFGILVIAHFVSRTLLK